MKNYIIYCFNETINEKNIFILIDKAIRRITKYIIENKTELIIILYNKLITINDSLNTPLMKIIENIIKFIKYISTNYYNKI